MGKPINKHTKNINELLDHIKKPADDLDAFEQEALEGFASLDNEQEALDLKARLDKRMNEEVFEKKKQPLFIYWSAAAGLALLIGLIFLFKTTNSIDKQEMAMNTSTGKEELKEMEFKPAPGTEDKNSDELKQESKAEGKKAVKDAKGNVLNEQSTAPGKAMDEEMVNSVASSEKSGEVAKPAEESDAMARNKESEAAKDLDDSRRSEPKAAPASSYGQASGAGAANSPVITTKNEKSDEAKSNETKSRIVAKEKKKSAAPETAPSQMDKSERSEAFNKLSSSIKTADLLISTKELDQLIEEFMKDKDYKKSFSCTLTINNLNEVENVDFENIELFKRAQVKEIKNFFKKLNCFKNAEYAAFSTYKISYTAK